MNDANRQYVRQVHMSGEERQSLFVAVVLLIGSFIVTFCNFRSKL